MSDAGRRWALVAVALLVLIGAAAVGIYAGLYNIAADVPHTQPVYWLLETVRDRSVEARVRDIVVPNDLKDPNRISRGAGNGGPFNSQVHSVGPTLFYKFGGEDEVNGGNDEGNVHEKKVGQPPALTYSMNVGVQFGLTDATSDTALKFQGSLSF